MRLGFFVFFLTLLIGSPVFIGSQTPPASRTAKPADDSQIYRNATNGFRYKIRFGWVDRTKEMREESMPPPSDPPQEGESSSVKHDTREKPGTQPASQGEVLLAVFERPPEAPGDTINSAVVIASESAAAYPGLKKADDYLGPLTDLTTAKGFQADGDPSISEIDGRQLVRADFIKPLTEKLAMHQSTLVVLSKEKVLFFTFIAGSEDEVEDLIENLHFGPPKPSAH